MLWISIIDTAMSQKSVDMINREVKQWTDQKDCHLLVWERYVT